MKVKDMMHKGVEYASPDTAIDAIARKMRELDVGAIPVASNGSLVGMITDRDITIRALADGRDASSLRQRQARPRQFRSGRCSGR